MNGGMMRKKLVMLSVNIKVSSECEEKDRNCEGTMAEIDGTNGEQSETGEAE
jgi:hypothetical protein